MKDCGPRALSQSEWVERASRLRAPSGNELGVGRLSRLEAVDVRERKGVEKQRYFLTSVRANVEHCPDAQAVECLDLAVAQQAGRWYAGAHRRPPMGLREG